MNSLNARRKWLIPGTRRCISQPKITPTRMLPATVMAESAAVSASP